MRKKSKIIHVLHAVGGVDVYLRLLLQHIDDEWFEFVVVHGENDTTKEYVNKYNQKIKSYRLPIQREISFGKDLTSIFKLRQIIKKEKPDLIHVHSAKGGIVGRGANLFFKSKVLYTPHAFSYLSAESNRKKFIYKTIERIFRFSGNYVLATSPSEANRAIKEVHYKKNRVIVYNNSVEPITEIGQQTEFKLPGKYICSIGRPSYQKNIETMVEVFAKVKKEVPDISLVLMGVGYHSPNEEQVKQLIKKHDLEDSFVMLPWVARESIFPIIRDSILYISTSRYEGLPYSLIESMALSKACVVSDCDGNRDLIKDGVNGRVYSQEQLHDSMHKGIIELIKDDKKRQEFEQNSYQLFNKNYNIDLTISNLKRIYNELIKNS